MYNATWTVRPEGLRYVVVREQYEQYECARRNGKVLRFVFRSSAQEYANSLNMRLSQWSGILRDTVDDKPPSDDLLPYLAATVLTDSSPSYSGGGGDFSGGGASGSWDSGSSSSADFSNVDSGSATSYSSD